VLFFTKGIMTHGSDEPWRTPSRRSNNPAWSILLGILLAAGARLADL
jgi:hypothetical protein